MVIAAGSYPAGRWFESDRRYQTWLLGQAVKTSPFHGGNTGSIPVGVTKWGVSSVGRASALQAGGHRFEPCTPHQQKAVFRSEILLFFFVIHALGRVFIIVNCANSGVGPIVN